MFCLKAWHPCYHCHEHFVWVSGDVNKIAVTMAMRVRERTCDHGTWICVLLSIHIKLSCLPSSFVLYIFLLIFLLAEVFFFSLGILTFCLNCLGIDFIISHWFPFCLFLLQLTCNEGNFKVTGKIITALSFQSIWLNSSSTSSREWWTN